MTKSNVVSSEVIQGSSIPNIPTPPPYNYSRSLPPLFLLEMKNAQSPRRVDEEERRRLANELFWPGKTEAEIAQEVQQYKERLLGACLDTLAATKGVTVTPGSITSELPRVRTRDAINYFFEVKGHRGIKDSTEKTYRKRLNQFAAVFEFLPLDRDTIREQYLSRYQKMSVKYRQGHQGLLAELYDTIKGKFVLPCNPAAGIEWPVAQKATEPNPLNAKWLPNLVSVAETSTQLAALHCELGCGWRPSEYMRIKAVDVRKALDRENPIILCHGKEREEATAILPETLEILAQLTPAKLADHDLVMRSRRFRAGVLQPMGEKAHSTLIYGLYSRAGVPEGFTPYNLRDTFATMVYEASGDWFLMERLLRHILDGQGKAYARYSLPKLCQDLQRFSPLRLIKAREFDSPPSPPAICRAPALQNWRFYISVK